MKTSIKQAIFIFLSAALVALIPGLGVYNVLAGDGHAEPTRTNPERVGLVHLNSDLKLSPATQPERSATFSAALLPPINPDALTLTKEILPILRELQYPIVNGQEAKRELLEVHAGGARSDGKLIINGASGAGSRDGDGINHHPVRVDGKVLPALDGIVEGPNGHDATRVAESFGMLADGSAGRRLKSEPDVVGTNVRLAVLQEQVNMAERALQAKLEELNRLKGLKLQYREAIPSDRSEVQKLWQFFTVHRAGGSHIPNPLTDPESVDRDLLDMPGNYNGITGMLRIVYDADTGEIISTAGFAQERENYPAIAELRKMYTKTELQGLGLGRRMAEVMIARARLAGYTSMRLSTAKSWTRGVKLYTDLGFRDHPLELKPGYGTIEEIVYMSMPL